MGNSSFKIWMVRAGEKGYLVDDLFLKEDIIALGWDEIGQIPKKGDYEQLKTKLRDSYPEFAKGRINQTAGQLWRLFKEFKKGDKVLTYDSGSRIYYTGEIISDYDFNAKYTFPHFRKVEWSAFPIDRDLLSTDSKNLLGSILTIFEIPESTWNEFEKLHSGYLNSTELEELERVQEQEELEQLKSDIVSRSTEFIKDIISNLDWENVEKLVAGLMETLGYKTRMTSRGSDLGSDIIASPDGLGMLDPRIKVEVKKRAKDKIGAPDLRNFIGSMRGHDRGIYVATSGFTKEALYEAERANFIITLIDSEMLVELIVENYENLKPELKALLPLRKIYWPI